MSQTLPRPNEDVASRVEEALHAWVYPERKRLTQLAARGPLSAQEMMEEVSRLTRAMSRTLGVARASVWRIARDRQSITCVDLYEEGHERHTGGTVIPAAAAPEYFKALITERIIAAHDARTDPRTSEFTPNYLSALNIGSMLDAPVFVDGRLTAVVCHEHVGPPRTWQAWEVLVAGTFADLVGMVFEAHQKATAADQRSPEALRAETIIKDLVHGEESMRALVDSSPVPLIITSAASQGVLYANARALKMFELEIQSVSASSAADLWVDATDRGIFLERVLRDGRIEDFETRVRSKSGKRYWVRLSAEAVKWKGDLALLSTMVDITRQKRAEDNLRTVFSHAPVSLVLSRLSDQVLLDGNEYAAKLFEIEVEAAKGKQAPDYWAYPADRDKLRSLVRAKGSVAGFEAELKTHTGKRFWAELSAAVIDFDGAPALLVGGHDITLRKQHQDALAQSENALRTLLDSAPLPLVLTGLGDGIIRYANLRAGALFEMPTRLLIGARASDFHVNNSDRENFLRALETEGRVEGMQVQLKTSSGREFWVLLTARTLELRGEQVFMVGFAEVTAQKELEQRLWKMATTDGLTGCTNRRHFFEVAQAELVRAGRYAHPTTLAMLDLDHFKSVNDTLGHDQGDAALKNVVAAVKPQLRETDILARYGGEEFCILFPETPLEGAQKTLERVREAVATRPLEVPNGMKRTVTVSIGASQWKSGETLDEVLKRADLALYEAKEAGRNRVATK